MKCYCFNYATRSQFGISTTKHLYKDCDINFTHFLFNSESSVYYDLSMLFILFTHLWTFFVILCSHAQMWRFVARRHPLLTTRDVWDLHQHCLLNWLYLTIGWNKEKWKVAAKVHALNVRISMYIYIFHAIFVLGLWAMYA